MRMFHGGRRARLSCLVGVFALIGTGFAFTAGTAGAAQPSGTPIKIGYLMTNSGASDANEAAVFSAWVKWANAHGGVNGHPVQVTTDIDPGNVALAVTDIQKFIAEGDAALVDADGNDAAWASIAESAGVPVFTSTETIAFSGDTAFGIPQSPVILPTEEMIAAKKIGVTKLALLYCTEYSQCSEALPFYQSVAKKEGIDLVYSAAVSGSAPNYMRPCLAAQAAGATAMVIGSTSATAERVQAAAPKQGYSPHLLAASGDYQKSFAGSPGTNGSIITVGSVPFFDTNDPAIKTMTDVLHQYDPSILSSPVIKRRHHLELGDRDAAPRGGQGGQPHEDHPGDTRRAQERAPRASHDDCRWPEPHRSPSPRVSLRRMSASTPRASRTGSSPSRTG